MTEWENAKKPVPEGIHPLFLTATTQEKFGCKEHEHVSPQQPYVYVSKPTFLDDIQFRGVISDFHPCKKHIETYPEDELLLVWDEEEDYGQNFYLVHSLEQKNAVLAEIEAKNALADGTGAGADADGGSAYAVEEYRPPVSKEWVSLGSEAEIEEERLVPTRELFVLRLWRPRRELGAAHKFSDRDSHEDPNMPQNDCRSYKDPNYELRRREHDRGVQALPTVAEAKTQTRWFKPANKALQYEPQALSPAEAAAQLTSPELRSFLATVRDEYELALQQNETMDVFEDDFATLAEDEGTLGHKSESDLRELQSFNHLQYCAGRMISCSEWQPLASAKGLVVAVSCAQRLTFEERVLVAGKVHTGYILLWNFSDPIHPQFVLEAPGDVYCFRFCPSDPDLIVGGVGSGQIVVWNLADAREKARELKAITGEQAEEGGSNTIVAKPVQLSAVDMSHRCSVADIAWLPTSVEVSEKGRITRKPGESNQPEQQFITSAADGQLLFWDLRKANEVKDETVPKDEKSKKEGWGPIYRYTMAYPESTSEPSTVQLTLDVPQDETLPCRLFVGSEEGELITVDLTNPNSEHGSRGIKKVISAHYSAVTALQRSPFVRDIFLSVGDWHFNLWKDGMVSPLFTSPFAACTLTCGVWSPTRPSVIIIGKADGSLDVWDLLDRSHEPSMTVNITSAAITAMQFYSSQHKQLLGVGDDQGTVHVMEVPRNLRRAANSEKQFTFSFFDREVKRVNYVAARVESRLQQAKAESGECHTDSGVTDSATTAETATPDEALEKEFRAMEKKFLEDMGIVDNPDVAKVENGNSVAVC